MEGVGAVTTVVLRVDDPRYNGKIGMVMGACEDGRLAVLVSGAHQLVGALDEVANLAEGCRLIPDHPWKSVIDPDLVKEGREDERELLCVPISQATPVSPADTFSSLTMTSDLAVTGMASFRMPRVHPAQPVSRKPTLWAGGGYGVSMPPEACPQGAAKATGLP